MKEISPARTAGLALALVLAGAVAILGGLSFHRKVEAFQALGFDAHLQAGHWRVTEVDALHQEHLQPGDRILLVNGQAAANLSQLRTLLRSRSEGALVVQRGEELVNVPYQRPPLDVDFPYLILALIGGVYLLIGLYTLLKDRKSQGRLFYLWCVTSAALYLFTVTPGGGFDRLDRTLYLAEQFARVLLPPLTLHLFIVFPTSLPTSPRLRRGIPFLYLPGVALLALQLDAIFFGGRWIAGTTASTLALLDRLDLYHLVLFSLAALGVLIFRLTSHHNWEEFRQIQWIAVGLAGGYIPFLLIYLLPHSLGLTLPEGLKAAAVLPLGLVPLTFAYAILRYKLWDIEVIVRDTISYTLTLLLGIFGFSLVHLVISRGIPENLAVARNLLSFMAGLLIAGLLVPTKRGISQTLERLQYRDTFGKRQALNALANDLIHLRDLDALCSAILTHLEGGLDLQRVNLYLTQEETLVLIRPERNLPTQVPVHALNHEAWSREFIVLSGIALPEGRPTPIQKLYASGYRYAFPLTLRGRWIGLVLTGYKGDHLPLNSEDVELIRNLLNQATLAMENARLLEALNNQLQEVVRLQRYNEGIIESSSAGIAVLDPQERIVSANLAFAALAGRERSEVVGRKLEEILPVRPLPPPGEGLMEVSFCDLQGVERYLQLSVATFQQGSEGELQVLVVYDVTDRVAMEKALKEKDRLAALGMLAAGLAHEVNTPITGISSYAQMLLAETPEWDPRYELLKKVERQTFRAARIVNNLLEYARNRRSDRRPVQILPLLTEALDLLGDRFGSSRIEVRWERSPGADAAVVLGNDGELQQVFTNLLLNALDAMADRGGTLTLRLEVNARRVRVEVEDTGPGIPPQQLDKIFEPFYSTKMARGGTGLGLAISHEIIQRHDGELRAESTPGEGSRFIVELPRFQKSAAASA